MRALMTPQPQGAARVQRGGSARAEWQEADRALAQRARKGGGVVELERR